MHIKSKEQVMKPTRIHKFASAQIQHSYKRKEREKVRQVSLLTLRAVKVLSGSKQFRFGEQKKQIHAK
jgi:hypothetical protein